MSTLTLCQLVAGAPLSRLPSQACDRCRRNKTKCDRLPVCTSCRKSGAACSYDATPRRRGPRPRRMSARNRADSRADRGETATPPQPELNDGESPAFSTMLDPPGQPGDVPGPYCESPGLCQPDEVQSGMGSRSPTASSPHSSSSQFDGTPEPSHIADIMGFTADPSPEGACLLETGSPPPAGGQVFGVNNTIRLSAANTPIFQDDDLGEERIPAWMETSAAAAQLPRSVFLPYVELFLERLYPVFPVLERHTILAALQDPLLEHQPLLPSFYCFLAALSAATIVQLNVTGPLSDFDNHQASGPGIMPLPRSPEFFVAETLRTRQDGDFIDCADDYSILSSFFLFAYYGNMERSRTAWYYLREAIGFALSMGLDDPETYLGLDTATHQRRRRLFWLLFVTERAYALQHRSTVILRPSLELPRVFESSEPRLIYGFITLVKVFRAVDEGFLAAWRANYPGAHDYPDESTLASMTTQMLSHSQDGLGALSMAEVDETQRLDILVTREWLRALVWRLRLRHGVRSRATSGNENQALFHQPEADAHHPFQISRSVLGITSATHRVSLEAHGIGMEQKVFDLASSLSAALQKEAATLTPAEFFSGQDLLHNFASILASFRNQTSRYLQPLLRVSAAVLSMGGIRMNPPLVDDMEADEGDAQMVAFLGMGGTAD